MIGHLRVFNTLVVVALLGSPAFSQRSPRGLFWNDLATSMQAAVSFNLNQRSMVEYSDTLLGNHRQDLL
jgi:hypothetical protein